MKREITKLAINAQGQIEQRKCHLQARKIPFQDIRKEAKIKSKDLVRIKNDAFYEELSENEICAELKKTSEDIRGINDEIQHGLKSFQRKEKQPIEDDHSALSNYGHLLLCVREMHDPEIHHLITGNFWERKTPVLWGLGIPRNSQEFQLYKLPII